MFHLSCSKFSYFLSQLNWQSSSSFSAIVYRGTHGTVHNVKDRYKSTTKYKVSQKISSLEWAIVCSCYRNSSSESYQHSFQPIYSISLHWRCMKNPRIVYRKHGLVLLTIVVMKLISRMLLELMNYMGSIHNWENGISQEFS